MTADWLLISCLASAFLALILAAVLAVFWLADRSDDRADYERQLSEGEGWPLELRHDQHPCPWDMRT